MKLKNAFEKYCEDIQVNNSDDYDGKFKRITKKLNKTYWETESDKENSLIVGSLGRNTAINGISDLDMNFELPIGIYRKYNAYETNKQSSLLQDVKSAIKETYPNTNIRGDGQVVVINFTNYKIEVCPSFRNSDNSFTYPDSNKGGKWKKTNPIPEIDESISFAYDTDGNFRNICCMTRGWKNSYGFKFNGLLIDTLAYNFLKDNSEYQNIDFDDYLNMFKDYFLYLKELDKEQSFWYSLGSNQKVYNKDKGKFIKKAKKAYNKIKEINKESEDLYEVLIDIFGKDFPDYSQEKVAKSALESFSFRRTEQSIENMFTVDILYDLTINCEVTQNGFRDGLLRSMPFLRRQKSLQFYIEENEVEYPYKVYWKVRNCGSEAKSRDCIRGQIIEDTGQEKRKESTDFYGEHYVECYIIKDGVCVARDKIEVPISTV